MPYSAIRYRVLAEAMPQLVWTANPQGLTIYFNHRWTEYTGLSEDESLGDSFLVAIHPDDRAHTQEIWQHSWQNGIDYEVEHRIRSHTGTYQWFISRALPVHNEHDDIVEWVGTCTNIDDQKRNSQLLTFMSRATALLSATLDYRSTLRQLATMATPDFADWCVIDLLNEEGQIERLAVAHTDSARHDLAKDLLQRGVSNPQNTLEILKGGKPVFYAQTDKAFLDRLVSDPTQQQLLQSLGMQSAMVLPLIARGNPLGTISLVDADSQRAFGPLDLAIAERLAERVAIAIDNAQLYQELWQFRTTLDRTLDCVFMFDPESLRFLYVNQGAINQLGYSHEELLRMTPHDLQQTETLDSFRGLITPLLNGTQSSITFETMYRHKLGYELPVEVLLQFVSPDNGPGRFVSIVRDITERRRAMVTLENRNRELNQFAYLISHDLKAPLRGIANLAQWIDEDLGETITPEVRGHLNLLHGRVARMERLINGLLDYSRIGRSAGTKSLVDVNVLIREVIDLLDPPAHVQITIAPHMPTLKTDQLLLQQVFANLISNSFKHHPGPAVHIQISVEALGSSYRFRITDNGPGIDPIYHDRIFGLFQTLVPKDQFESSGIGLAIVKKIVEQYGGAVQIESQLGAGATFTFTWPA